VTMAPEAEPRLCECGCGEPVKRDKYGLWSRWRPGHQYGRAVTGNSIRNLQRKRRRAGL
jgi:hypothetical protein